MATAQTVGLLAFAALMWAAFVVAKDRAAAPMISPGLFSIRAFGVSVVATFSDFKVSAVAAAAEGLA